MLVRYSIAPAIFVLSFAAAAEETYVFDPAHTQPSFEVLHLGFSLQNGKFTKATGKVTVDRAAKTGVIEVSIDPSSVDTGYAQRDAVVKGENLFDVAKFPTMIFKSTSLKFDGDTLVGVDGDLTMVGVTKPVSLKVTNLVCGDNPLNKKAMCGAEATTAIKRSEWGMKWGIPKSFADEVKITIPIEAYKE